ncbi:MAG: anion permease [Candidatus Korobacteraceae bacterium]|jgi:DASS family divalent anion:Na+ symporter
MKNNFVRILIVVAIGAAIWFSPVPAGLKLQTWHLFAIFVTTILGFILQPLPMGAFAFTAVTFTALSGTLKPLEATSGFASGTIWLIVSAFLFCRGIIKTGLGRRVAFELMKRLGTSTLKLAYTLAITDLVVSPATPSNTARGGGVVFPIARSLASAFESEPGPTGRRMGAFLMTNCFQATTITSAMFMTSCAPNPMLVALTLSGLGLTVTWQSWAVAAIVPGIASLIVMPLVLYKVYPPEIKQTPQARAIAEKELAIMGPMTRAEKIVSIVFVSAIGLWATSSLTKIDATTVAMLAVSVLLLTKVIDWKDALEERGAWDTLVWLGGLFGLADYLDRMGFGKWVGQAASGFMGGFAWVPTLAIVLLLYCYTHYLFAGLAAHDVALYIPLCLVAIAAGAPKYLVAYSMLFVSSLVAGLTHYSTGVAPIFFGAGFVDQHTWWKIGFIMSVVNMVIWIGLGGVWWKVLGLW